MKAEYRIPFLAGINDQNCSSLIRNIVSASRQDNFQHAVILMASTGGSIDTSIGMYNTLMQLGIPMRVHAVGRIASAAIPVFLAFKIRTASPIADFSFHQYSWNLSGEYLVARLHEYVNRLDHDMKLAQDIVSRHCHTTQDILDAIIGRSNPILVNAIKAQSLGIISEIFDESDTSRDDLKVRQWSV